jgi:hypothetical protein
LESEIRHGQAGLTDVNFPRTMSPLELAHVQGFDTASSPVPTVMSFISKFERNLGTPAALSDLVHNQ